jgi:GcrA cell cycle regulator
LGDGFLVKFWTDGRTERCRELWAGGSTASEIGAELGCTRNAVLSKVHRSGWAGRGASQPPRPKPQPTPRRPRPVARAAALPPPPEPLAADERAHTAATSFREGGPKPLLELGAGECRWPLGEPGAPGFGFCAADARWPDVYCGRHSMIARDRGRKPREFVPWRKKSG